MISGPFTKVGGTTRNRLARLNIDGSLDGSFDPKGGPDAPPSIILVLPDEKILVGGTFNLFNGVARTNLVRLNADGTMDSSFIASGITNISQRARSISVEPNGKILFVTTDVGIHNHLVRLNQDGSKDISFTSAITLVDALTVVGDGRIYAAGVTNNPTGNYSRKLYRWNPDGSVDSQFVPVEVGLVYSLALEPDGLSLLLTGNFSRVNGVPRTSLARVFTVPQPRLTAADYSGGSFRFLLRGETSRMYRIDASTTLLDWLTMGTVSLTNSPQPFVDSNGTNFTRWFYRAVAIH